MSWYWHVNLSGLLHSHISRQRSCSSYFSSTRILRTDILFENFRDKTTHLLYNWTPWTKYHFEQYTYSTTCCTSRSSVWLADNDILILFAFALRTDEKYFLRPHEFIHDRFLADSPKRVSAIARRAQALFGEEKFTCPRRKGEKADFLDFKSQKNPKIPKSKSIFLPMNDVVSAWNSSHI